MIDLQHGGAAEADLPAMTTAIRLAGATPIARVRHAHTADIGRALDLGCEGVIVPNVDSAAQARRVARAVRYPPAGYRSAGGVLAAGEPFCLVMAESAGAVAELDAILAVDGVDGLYVGPWDLSLSLGCEPDPDDPVLNRALRRVWAASAAAGKPVGVHATGGAVARQYREAWLHPDHDRRRRGRDHPPHRRPARSRPGLRVAQCHATGGTRTGEAGLPAGGLADVVALGVGDRGYPIT